MRIYEALNKPDIFGNRKNGCVVKGVAMNEDMLIATIIVPAFIIGCMVIALYIKDRNKRL